MLAQNCVKLKKKGGPSKTEDQRKIVSRAIQKCPNIPSMSPYSLLLFIHSLWYHDFSDADFSYCLYSENKITVWYAIISNKGIEIVEGLVPSNPEYFNMSLHINSNFKNVDN